MLDFALRRRHGSRHQTPERNRYARNRAMSGAIIAIGGAMFGIPLFLLLGIELVGDIPPPVLKVGLWSMVLGIIVGGIGAALGLAGE